MRVEWKLESVVGSGAGGGHCGVSLFSYCGGRGKIGGKHTWRSDQAGNFQIGSETRDLTQ